MVVMDYTWKDIINLLAIFLWPVISLFIWSILQDKKEKKKLWLKAKSEIFETVYKFRETWVDVPYELVNALNMIDVVYRDDKWVIDAWDRYFAWAINPTSVDLQTLKADLLSEMSIVLWYNIKPTKFLRSYMPSHLSNTITRRQDLEEQMRIFFTNQNKHTDQPLFSPDQIIDSWS